MMDIYQKIHEAKRAENIIIDASFKAMLKEKIMAKAALLPSQKSPSHSFFQKWRYSLALLPAFLLMMVVALQANHLPVTIQSETVNPDISSKQIAQTTPPDEKASIQTFAGSSVLPKRHEETSSPSMSDQPSQIIPSDTTPATKIEQQTVQPQPPAPASSTNNYPAPVVPQNSYQIPSPPSQSTPDPENATVFQDSPNPQNSYTPSNNSGIIENAPSTNGLQINNSLRQENIAIPQTQQQNTAKLPALNTTFFNFSFPILYQGTFSNDEKTVINQTIIFQLTNNKTIKSVSVSENRITNMLTVNLIFMDGTTQVFTYQKDLVTQNWLKMPAS